MFEWNLTSSAQSNLRAQNVAKLTVAEFIFTILPQKSKINYKKKKKTLILRKTLRFLTLKLNFCKEQ